MRTVDLLKAKIEIKSEETLNVNRLGGTEFNIRFDAVIWLWDWKNNRPAAKEETVCANYHWTLPEPGMVGRTRDIAHDLFRGHIDDELGIDNPDALGL